MKYGVTDLKGMKPKMRIDKPSDNLYTPDWLIELIIEFYDGQIDLDPSADPRKRIPALNHYTFEDDGLSKEWKGNVFCNPPYSKSNGRTIADWVQKGYESVEADSSRETQVLFLLPANTDTKWGQRILHRTHACTTTVLFISGRIKFLGSNYQPTSSVGLFSSMLVYIGLENWKFWKKFRHLGVII